METSLVLVLLAAVAGGAGAQCETGWVEIQDRCYGLLQTVFANWTEAEDYCQGQGGNSAVVDQADVLRGLYEYITTYELSGSFWLGASDLSLEGNWLWRTSIRVDRGTPYWALHSSLFGYSLEPQGGAEENCLALAGDRFYYMDDRNCSELYHPLCEKP